tara:strand:- start:4553 stop:5074 length:522 start_codon:yes stop_codon:yes gene_type:complete
MKIEKVKISEVSNNPNNPRVLKDDKFKKLVNSIKGFPQMLEIRPIVVNNEMIVLGGNMRLKACIEAGLKEVHIIKAENLTKKQQDEFIIKDNVSFGEWDWDSIANEWESEELESWGMDIWIPEVEEEPKELKDLSEELKDTYEVIIECKNDGEQEEVYNKLIKEGYICRVLTL